MRQFIIFAALLVMLAGCATRSAVPVTPDIYVMRHLHTPEGVRDPDLTAEGQAAASRLAALLARNPPGVIFVSDTKRARQTAAPAAARFKVTPTIYDPRDTPGVIARVMGQEGTVLVVGHSNTVPDIVAGLGGKRPGPLVHADFGDLWRILGPGRKTTRIKV